MKKAMIPIAALTISAISFGCGGAAEKKQNETKAPATLSNANALITNTNSSSVTNNRDADDTRSTMSNMSNSKVKSGDADDQRSANKLVNANRTTKRGDADDRGKKDSDDDDDR